MSSSYIWKKSYGINFFNSCKITRSVCTVWPYRRHFTGYSRTFLITCFRLASIREFQITHDRLEASVCSNKRKPGSRELRTGSGQIMFYEILKAYGEGRFLLTGDNVKTKRLGNLKFRDFDRATRASSKKTRRRNAPRSTFDSVVRIRTNKTMPRNVKTSVATSDCNTDRRPENRWRDLRPIGRKANANRRGSNKSSRCRVPRAARSTTDSKTKIVDVPKSDFYKNENSTMVSRCLNLNSLVP